MNLKVLTIIAEIFDGVDFDKCYTGQHFSYLTFFKLIGKYKREQLETLAGKNNVYEYIFNMLERYKYELNSIADNKPQKKSSRKPLSTYQNIMSFYYSAKNLGFDSTTHTLKEIKTLVELKGMMNTEESISHVRSALKQNHKNIFDFELEQIEDWDEEIGKLLDHFIEVARGYNG